MKFNLLNLNRRGIMFVLVICLVFIFTATVAFAALTLNTTSITSDGALTLTPATNTIINGNVGIGTNNPTALFQVAENRTPGTVSVTAGGTVITGTGTQFLSTISLDDKITIVTSAGSETTGFITGIISNTSITVDPAFTGSASNVAYAINGGERFSVLENGETHIFGDVHIGSNSVGSIFPGFGQLYIRSEAGSLFPPRLVFQDLTHANKSLELDFVTDDTIAGTTLGFTNGVDPFLTVNGLGNVGIGTATPEDDFAIIKNSVLTNGVAVGMGVVDTNESGSAYIYAQAGAQANNYMNIENTGSTMGTNSNFTDFNSAGSIRMGLQSTGGLNLVTQANAPIRFATGGLDLSNERMRITGTGNVGIGTATPTSPLQVVGLPVFANNAAAIAGGLTAGAFYRTGADPDPVMVVH